MSRRNSLAIRALFGAAALLLAGCPSATPPVTQPATSPPATQYAEQPTEIIGGTPTHKAASVSFTDTDTHAEVIGGTVTAGKAANEADIDDYVLYWGSDSSTRLAGRAAIDSAPKNGGNVIFTITPDTPIPTGATHFIVLTRKGSNEMAEGVSTAISDNSSGGKSKTRIKEEYARYAPAFSRARLFDAVPEYVAPFSAGALNPAFAADGLKAANFIRYLADLPHGLVADATLSSRAQKGAVLLRVFGDLTHEPSPMPAGMDSTFYDEGRASCGASLLGQGFPSLNQFVQVLTADDVAPAVLGHRRLILSPRLAKTGFGFATSDSTNFALMEVFDMSGTAPDYQFTAWPAKGDFPVEFFPPGTWWSITLNPSHYASGSVGSAVVTITRSDGVKLPVSRPETLISDNTLYGVNNCIAFKLAETSYLGKSYRIQVSGIQTSAGAPATLDYTVSFFDMIP